MLDIISIGNITWDITLKGLAIFIEKRSRKFVAGHGICFPLGSKIRAEKLHLDLGGGAFNCSLSFAKLELKTGLIGRAGKDKEQEILEVCQKNKVKPFIQKDLDRPTSCSIIILSNHERVILSHIGAGKFLNFEQIPFSRIKTKWFFLSNLFEREELILNFLNFAKKNKIKIASNPSKEDLRFFKKNLRLLDNYSVFILNQEEASFLTGISYFKEKQIFKKLDDLVNGIVVMTKGRDGATVSDGKILYKAPIIKERRFRDKTGAGDAFSSGFITGLISKNDIEYAIKLGTANACSVVEHLGSQNGFLTLEEFKKRKWPKLTIEKITI